MSCKVSVWVREKQADGSRRAEQASLKKSYRAGTTFYLHYRVGGKQKWEAVRSTSQVLFPIVTVKFAFSQAKLKEAELMQGAVQPVAAAVPGEDASRAVAAVCRGGQTNDE